MIHKKIGQKLFLIVLVKNIKKIKFLNMAIKLVENDFWLKVKISKLVNNASNGEIINKTKS